MPLYAAIDPDGELLSVSKSQQSAIHDAARTSSRVQVEGGEEGRSFAGFNDFGRLAPEKMPDVAMRNAGIPVIDIERVMKLSLEEAHARLLQFFPKTRTRKSGEVVPVGSYSTPRAMVDNLLGQNYKTAKSTSETPVDVQGLSLLPYSMGKELSGRTLPQRGLGFCVGSSEACRRACLVYSGHNVIDIYNQVVKVSRTEAISLEPVAFGRILVEALKKHFNPRGGTKGFEPLVRLNVFSDLPWELLFPGIFDMFTGAQFYDYTKVPGREPPENYDLTFSWSGENEEWVEYEVDRGRRIAVVFLLPGGSSVKRRKASLPKTFMGLQVVDGDVTDARPFDPAPSIVGLRWKPHGLGKNIDLEEHAAFVVPVREMDGQLIAAESSRMSPIVDPDEQLDNPHSESFYRRGQTGVE